MSEEKEKKSSKNAKSDKGDESYKSSLFIRNLSHKVK